MFAIAEVGVWFDLFHHGPHHIDATLPKVRTFGWVAIKNQESTGSRDTIRPAATAAISSQFAPHFYSEARKVSRASPALNRVTVLPAGANFCKACSLMAKSASI